MTRVNLPVILWMTAAFLSFLASVGCWFFVDKQTGLYIGLWVPSVLALGCLLNPLQRSRAGGATASPGTQARQPNELR